METKQTLATEALKVLKRKGYRMTPQRQAIVTEVMSSKGHISAPAISAKVQATMPGVTPSTIYRTLDMLERSEERRVGKECRSWRGPYDEKEKTNIHRII